MNKKPLTQVQMVQYPQFKEPYQLVQPVQPWVMRYTQQQNGPSPKTMSDIENFKENQKMRDIPSFCPNSSGFFHRDFFKVLPRYIAPTKMSGPSSTRQLCTDHL